MTLQIRPIERRDIGPMRELIFRVLEEHGCLGPGYAGNDVEMEDLHRAYSQERAAYWVVVDETDTVLGGAGVAQLNGAGPEVCELRKMYFDSKIRGKGMAQKLMDLVIENALEFKFEKIYLETVPQMTAAQKLYQRNGFQVLDGPMGDTGHYNCGVQYLKVLN